MHVSAPTLISGSTTSPRELQLTPTMKVTVPHPPPVIRDAGATVVRKRRSLVWPVVAICVLSFAIGALAGHVVKSDGFKRHALAPVVARTARTTEVSGAGFADGAVRSRAPLAPAAPVRVARRRAPATNTQSDADLELAFRAELHK